MNLTKKNLRDLIYSKRSEVNDHTKKQWDGIILEKLLQSEFYKKADVIFTYVSFKGEVDTIKLIEKALSDCKTVCVPKVISKKEGMEAYRITSLKDLEKSSYGILEPKNQDSLIIPSDIDLIITPGVAFSKTNGRIGYGGGFYDRFFKRVTAQTTKVALSYSFQIFESIPMDEFDEKVDFIITNEL